MQPVSLFPVTLSTVSPPLLTERPDSNASFSHEFCDLSAHLIPDAKCVLQLTFFFFFLTKCLQLQNIFSNNALVTA